MARIILFILLLGFAVSFGGYYFYKTGFGKLSYRQAARLEERFSTSNPSLTLDIFEPKEGAVILDQTNIRVSGRTLPNIEVFVNDVELRSDAYGNFSAFVDLDEGENIIVVIASDQAGGFTEKQLVVTVQGVDGQ